jgi:hypothetical protein
MPCILQTRLTNCIVLTWCGKVIEMWNVVSWVNDLRMGRDDLKISFHENFVVPIHIFMYKLTI